MLEQLKADLIRDEGVRLKPYRDTVGKLTIGVGRNLDDVGISQTEATAMLDADISEVIKELDIAMPWWRGMPEPAQLALANQRFQLGLPRLKGFANMLAALEQGRFDEAANHARQSKWAEQVPGRAERIAKLYEEASTIQTKAL